MTKPHTVVPLFWRHELPLLTELGAPVLPYSRGRRDADTRLNEDGVLLDTRGLARFIAFDETRGRVRCEAGITLGTILDVTVPRGWFLPVTPGTRHVTLGGAIAHDVHGKSQHVTGTFGRHVTRLEVLRSSGARLECAPDRNAELYRATIGGMGLTGLIVWAEVQLQRVAGPMMVVRTDPIRELDEFWALSESADAAWPYTAAWLDGVAWRRGVVRGVFQKSDHVAREPGRRDRSRELTVPLDARSGLLNEMTVGAFNAVYYGRQVWRRGPRTMHYRRVLFPRDTVRDWNRLYADAEFVRYQCVVPEYRAAEQVGKILNELAEAGEPPLVAALKRFGNVPSPGLLSFPRPGTTLALDLPLRGDATLRVLESLDALVVALGGAVYHAKDTRMSAATFRASFPQVDTFARFVDPGFSSSFWRRVRDAAPAAAVAPA